MKYLRLLRVSLLRKKFRTALTIGSFAVAMFLFGLLAVVQLAFNQGVEVGGRRPADRDEPNLVHSAAADRVHGCNWRGLRESRR